MARGRIFFNFSDNVNTVAKRAEKMLAKKIKSQVSNGEINRPKNRCPSCFHVHSEDVPEKCWIKGMKGDYSNKKEFEKYILQNKKGIFIS